MKKMLLAATFLVTLFPASVTMAQVVDPNAASVASLQRDESVLNRPRPEYDAIGVRDGAFLFFPKLTTSVTYDDNIYASSLNIKGDEIAQIQPDLRVRSDWSRNLLEAEATGTYNEYFGHGSENTFDYGVKSDGRLDLGYDDNLSYLASYGRDTEARYAPAATPATTKPVRYDLGEIDVQGVHEINRLRILGEFDVRKFTYDPAYDQTGASVGENQRDRVETYERARAEYAWTPGAVFFLSGEVSQVSYDMKPPAAAFDRDSTGYNVAGGVRVDLTHLAKGEFQLGYLDETYSSAAFGEVSGFAMHGKVDFFPTQLTTVTVRADRTVAASGDILAPSFLTTNGGVEVDHELLRNLLLMARVFYENDDYTGIGRTDNRWTGRVGATYFFNRHIGLSGYYDHMNVDSSGVDRINSFKVNQLILAIVLQD